MVSKQSSKKSKTIKAKSGKKTRKTGKRKSSKKLFWLKPLLAVCSGAFILLAAYIGYCYITLPDVSDAVSHTRQPSTLYLVTSCRGSFKALFISASVMVPCSNINLSTTLARSCAFCGLLMGL